MSMKQQLLHRIQNRSAVISVVGMGYVGMPLAVEFAEAGFRVIAVDVDTRKVEALNRGESYIDDVPTSRLKPLVESGKLTATSDYAELRDVDAISICVPTPLSENRDPDMSFINSAMDSIVAIAHEGLLVVLESTTYPGTTEDVIVPRLSNDTLKVGETVFIAFSPERIDPGNKTFGVRNTPKIVGGVTPACNEVTAALYSTGIDTIVAVSSPTTAEMSKLLENTFRAVNIGLANEMAIMCDKLGVDVWEVVQTAASKPFGFMAFYPGPGLGGHCIPIDPLYLSWKLKSYNYTARFIELANDVNSGMPHFVVDKVTEALNEHSKAVRGSRIVILGVAYKANIDDVRESPALEVIELLQHKGADVVYHDPFVPSIRMDGYTMESCDYSPELLKEADCVVIVTNHHWYNWREVLDNSALIVDSRNAMAEFKQDAKVFGLTRKK